MLANNKPFFYLMEFVQSKNRRPHGRKKQSGFVHFSHKEVIGHNFFIVKVLTTLMDVVFSYSFCFLTKSNGIRW